MALDPKHRAPTCRPPVHGLRALPLLAVLSLLACSDDTAVSEAERHWKPCDHGRLYDAEADTCTGTAALETHTRARRICEEMDSERPSNWRLPTAPELRALLHAHPEFTPARRWTLERGEEGAIALDPAGYPREQQTANKRLRFRCLQE